MKRLNTITRKTILNDNMLSLHKCIEKIHSAVLDVITWPVFNTSSQMYWHHFSFIKN